MIATLGGIAINPNLTTEASPKLNIKTLNSNHNPLLLTSKKHLTSRFKTDDALPKDLGCSPLHLEVDHGLIHT